MLVATGSAIFVLLSIHLTVNSGDVTRIIAQVVTGIGFLGAGVIFREGVNVHGLASAATIWCSAAIGCMAAAGFFLEALICITGSCDYDETKQTRRKRQRTCQKRLYG